jgi:hypothetical protein
LSYSSESAANQAALLRGEPRKIRAQLLVFKTFPGMSAGLRHIPPRTSTTLNFTDQYFMLY